MTLTSADLKGDTLRGARYIAERQARYSTKKPFITQDTLSPTSIKTLCEISVLNQRRIRMPKGSGITKEMKASEELQAIVKDKKVSRGNAVKALWKYIKKHDLKSNTDGRIIKCDDKLSALFAKIIKKDRVIENRGRKIKVPAGRIFMSEIVKGLSQHLS